MSNVFDTIPLDEPVTTAPHSPEANVFDTIPTDEPAQSNVFDSIPTEEPQQVSAQTPLETGARAAAQSPGQSVMSAYSGLGRFAENFGDTLGQKLPGPIGPLAKGYFKAITTIPRTLGPIAKDIADESQRVYAPDSQRNPIAAAVGSGIGQALPMAAAAVLTGPYGPLALGAGQGMDQGIDQAETMGITSPAKKLALGTAYGGVELLTEKLGGFGSHSFTSPVKRTLGQMIKEGGKTILSEGIEEPIAGIAQDALAAGFAPPSYDSRELRPYYPTPSGMPMVNADYFNRRGLETVGGMAGGVAGAGVQALVNRATPAAQEPATVEGDPLAAFAATMPEAPRVPVPPVSVESGMFDAPVMEGDVLNDFNIQPDMETALNKAEQEGEAWDAEQAARKAAYDQQFPVWTPPEAVGVPPSGGQETADEPAKAGTTQQGPPAANLPPIASVTGKAQQGSPSSAPVDAAAPEADAGSSPATGGKFDSRATSERMASESGAAQNANEPSPGGLSEAEIPVKGRFYRGENTGNGRIADDEPGGIHFTQDQSYARQYGSENLRESDVNLRRALDFRTLGEKFSGADVIRFLDAHGVDTNGKTQAWFNGKTAREVLNALPEIEAATIHQDILDGMGHLIKEAGFDGYLFAEVGDFKNPSVVVFSEKSLNPTGAEGRTSLPRASESPPIPDPSRPAADSAGVAADPAVETPVQDRPQAAPAFGSVAPTMRRVPVIPDAPYGGKDVLDFLNDNPIAVPAEILSVINQKKGAKLAPQSKGDFNWLEKYDVPKAWRKYFFSESGDTSSNINEVAQNAHDEGLISDPTPDALMAAVLDQISAREGYTRDVDARERQLAEEEKALIAREKAEAKRRGKWADQVIAESMETPFIGLDPRLMAAYTVKGAQLVQEGFTSFNKWSREMISRFGEKVRDLLAGIWQSIQNEARLMTTNKGAINPNGRTPQPEIKLTHEAEAERMAAEGKEPLPTGGQGTVDEWKAEAAARVQQPGAATALVSDILNQQRPATPVEHYMLMNYAAALDEQLAGANATLTDPAATPEARTAAAAQRGTLDAERDRVAVAQQIAGSKAGAALGARARGLERGVVPSLAQMVADITLIQDPTGRTPLPPEERAVIEQTHAKMVEAEAAAMQHEEKGSQTDLHAELKKLLDEAQAQIAAQKEQLEAQEHALNVKPGKLRLYTNSKAKLKEWSDDGRAAREELLRMIGVQTNASFGIELLPQVARMVRGYMADGFLTADAVAKKLVKAVPPDFYNSLKNFLPQIMDAADKLGREDAKIKTPDDIKAKARKSVLANDGKLPRSTARTLALAHITDHLMRGDKTLSAAKIAKLVQADLEEFQPGITEREARDLISGYGQATFPSKDEARAELRNLAAQMQKITQLEALKARERLLKSGPQRDKPSAELRDLQKQVEELKRDMGYTGKSREEELKSARDRIQTALENQIEDLQRVLAGKQRPTAPREAVVYDAELSALKDLRDTLRAQVAEMPEHKLASDERRNRAAMKSAQKSEAEWNRRAAAMQWTKPGKPSATFTAEVEAARAKAKESRANFESLKKAADPRNDPDARTLREFKRRTQAQIDTLNERMAKGDFEPKPRTPRQVKHDAESEKLRHELAQKKRDWIDLKLQHKYQMMSVPRKGLEMLRKVYNTSRAIMTGGEFSGILRQGFFKLVSHPGRVLAGDVPAMLKAFRSAEGEFSLLNSLQMRTNGITGRYKEAKLALNNPHDYSSMIAEGNYRTAWANKIPFIAGTGRAYTALLAHMRADMFDMMVEKLEKANAKPLTTRELEAIGEFVNDSTGAGKLGFGNNQIRSGETKEILGAFIFSPSFVASRFRLLFGASMWGGSMRTRQAIAGEYLRMAAGTAAVYALLSALADPDDDRDRFDPKSSNFLKLQYGKTRMDIMAGLNQAAVLIAREWTGQISRKGQTVAIRGEGMPYGGTNATDVMVNFLRSKASPAGSFAWNRLSGADFSGEPTNIKRDLLQFTLPITGGSIVDIARTEPLKRAIPLSAAAYLGFGTQTRTAADEARRR